MTTPRLQPSNFTIKTLRACSPTSSSRPSPTTNSGARSSQTASVRARSSVWHNGLRTPTAATTTRESKMTDINRFERIERAYQEALAGRDPEVVSIFDLLPTIFAAPPYAGRRRKICARRMS
jgi:hypothetical protein